VPAPDCLVIEDAAAGVEAARTAGMTVIAVRTTLPLITDWLDRTHR
jgi:beta-phosphoglucomutase-like phosphatase (HAD superfamily)